MVGIGSVQSSEKVIQIDISNDCFMVMVCDDL